MNQRANVIFKYLLFSLLLMTCYRISEARQFRVINPIASPVMQQEGTTSSIKPVQRVEQLSRKEIEPLVRQIIEKWNTPEMVGTLSEQFHDRTRLLDVVDRSVPRDATLRIQSIQGIQTLEQYIEPATESAASKRVSIVSTTIQTQLEFNSSEGLVRLPGTTEMLLKVTQTSPE